MIRLNRLTSTAAVAALGLIISACALLKSPDPVQAYRFGATPAFAAAGQATVCEPVTVALRRVEFAHAARGDRILAVTGAEAAYIGGARWVSEAETLFRASLEDAFAAGAPCIRLAPGVFARDGLVLSVDVRRFETTYASPGSAPQVRLVAVATLVRPGDRTIVGEHRTDVTEPVEVNRVSAIVAGYDRANSQAVRQIVDWVAATAPGIAPVEK